MRKVIYICDRCNKKFNEEGIVKLSVQKIEGSGQQQVVTKELCNECYHKLGSVFYGFMNSKNTEEVPEDDATPIEEHVTPKPVENKSNESNQPVIPEVKPVREITDKPSRTGAMSPQEKDIIMRMVNEGCSVEEIAEKLNRSVKGVKRCIGAMEGKYSGDVDSTVTDVITSREEEGKKLDVGGIIALAKAGWTPRSISHEHHCSVEEVTSILAEYRKKLQK